MTDRYGHPIPNQGINMISGRAGLLSAIFACLLMFAVLPAPSMASEESEKALKEQMRLMQQQMEDLKKEVQSLRHEQQTAPGSNAPAQPPAPTKPPAARRNSSRRVWWPSGGEIVASRGLAATVGEWSHAHHLPFTSST